MEVGKSEILEVIEKLLETLSPKEVAVIDGLYGLRGQEPKIVEQIAEDLRLSHGRVHQLWSAVMLKITLPSRIQITNELLRLDPEVFSRHEIRFPLV